MTQARDGGPALPLYWSEIARASAGWGFFLASLPLSPTLPAGDGHPVLVLPGLLAGDGSDGGTALPLARARLRRLRLGARPEPRPHRRGRQRHGTAAWRSSSSGTDTG
jgi:hypothetical protein